MFRLKNSSKFFIILRLVLGSIFIYASTYKILSPGSFAHQIYNFKLLPPWAINPVALVLPWLQFFSGLAIIFNKLSRAASWCVVSMMAIFQLALISALFRGLNVACGCFKSGGDPATWWTVGRDFLILILATINLIYLEYKVRR